LLVVVNRLALNIVMLELYKPPTLTAAIPAAAKALLALPLERLVEVLIVVPLLCVR
jgi:hypothetical protein